MFEVTIKHDIPIMAELYDNPNIESENWRIRTFTVEPNDYRKIIYDRILPGKYVMLQSKNLRKHNMEYNSCMMSDTPMERFTNQDFINYAKGNVLIAGLGIGMVPAALAAKNEVTSITIIELDPEVISLVEPLIRKYVPNQHKITIVQADAYTYPETYTGEKYDFTWLDIWPEFPCEYSDYMMFEELFEKYHKIMTKPRCNGWGYEYAAECRNEYSESINPLDTYAFEDYTRQLIRKSNNTKNARLKIVI